MPTDLRQRFNYNFLTTTKTNNMKITEQFFKAKKESRYLSSMLVMKTNDKKFVRLCLNVPIPHTDKTELVFVDCDTDIRIENFGTYCTPRIEQREVDIIKFHCHVWIENGDHFATFFNAIKKNSDIGFLVRVNCQYDELNKNGYFTHALYGEVDGKRYMLNEITGNHNTTSPVTFK